MVLSGKDHYKMVRYHSLLNEAIMHLKWEAFEEWLQMEDQTEILTNLEESLNNLVEAMKENDKSLVRDMMNSVKNIMILLQPMWNSFTLDLSVTAQFWSVYTDMVLIMKQYLLSERSGNRLGHLEEDSNMVPYIVSTKA